MRNFFTKKVRGVSIVGLESNEFTIKSVEHRLTSKDYTCEVEFEG